MRLLETIRADRAVNHEPRMRFFLAAYRVAKAARGDGERGRIWSLPLVVAFKVVSSVLLIELPLRARVGVPLVINHGFGLVVHPDAIIGDNCVLKHGVTIGIRRPGEGLPVLGRHVQLGSGAQILGPVHIGDDVIVGAGAIVLDDIPAGGRAVGQRARVILPTPT